MRVALRIVTVWLLASLFASPASAGVGGAVRNFFGGNPFGKDALTTNIKDATGEVPYLDNFAFFDDRTVTREKSLFSLGTDEDGSILVKPGEYSGTFQSFCLHAGTYGPTRGNGYVTAPLKGPKSYIIGKILGRAGRHPEIPQYQIQNLIWMIEAHTDYKDMSSEMKGVLIRLIAGKSGIPTPKDLLELSGGMLRVIPSDKLNDLLRKADEIKRPIYLAQSIVRRVNEVGGTFGEIERAAVLHGNPPRHKDDRDIPASRWVYSPNGLFLRFNASSYKQTQVSAYCPEPFAVRCDKAGRIREIEAKDHSYKLTTQYTDGSPAEDQAFRAHEISAVTVFKDGAQVFQTKLAAAVFTGVLQASAEHPADDAAYQSAAAHYQQLRDMYGRFIGGKPRKLTNLVVNLTHYRDGLSEALSKQPDVDPRIRDYLNNFTGRVWMATTYQWINEDKSVPRVGRYFPEESIGRSATIQTVQGPLLLLEIPLIEIAVGAIEATGVRQGTALAVGLAIGSTTVCPGETGRQRLGIAGRPVDGTVLNSDDTDGQEPTAAPLPVPSAPVASVPGGNPGDPDNDGNEGGGKKAETSDEITEVIDSIKENAEKGDVTPDLENYWRDGGEAQADADFDSVVEQTKNSGAKPQLTKGGPGRKVTLDDGTTVMEYPEAKSTGKPTIQVNRPDGSVIKFRYR